MAQTKIQEGQLGVEKVNRGGDTMTGDLLVPNHEVLSAGFSTINTTSGNDGYVQVTRGDAANSGKVYFNTSDNTPRATIGNVTSAGDLRYAADDHMFDGTIRLGTSAGPGDGVGIFTPSLSLTPEGSIIASGGLEGTNGQVLTSRGVGNAVEWTTPSGGGGFPFRVQSWFLSGVGNPAFGGVAFNNWNVSTIHNPPSPELVDFTPGTFPTPDNFQFLELGTYRATLICKITATNSTLPNDPLGFGTGLVLSGGSVFSPNPSFHQRFSSTSYPSSNQVFVSFAPGDMANVGREMTWVDVFILQVSPGVNMNVDLYAYSYVEEFSTFSCTIQMMIEKISNDGGS